MSVVNVSLVTACWGGYWEKYGEQWMRSVQGLNTAPSEVVIATDVPLDVPFEWRQIPAVEPYFFGAWNDVIQAASNDWVAFLSMDDELFPDSLDDLVLGGDVVVAGLLDSQGTTCVPDPARFDNILDESDFPLVGWPIYRKQFHALYPFRAVNYTDWISALEYRHHGADVRFDPKVRYKYNLHKGQFSRQDGTGHVRLMKDLLRHHVVKPGPEWPPVIL